MILPILAATAVLGGGAYVCGKGVTVQAAKIGDVRWRIRFACWRYIAEVQIDGKWAQAGVYPLSAKAIAISSAINVASLEAYTPGGIGASSQPMVRIVRATKVS